MEYENACKKNKLDYFMLDICHIYILLLDEASMIF